MGSFSDLENLARIRGLVKGRRTVRAPSPSGPVGPPALLSVELDEDEEVQWHWTYFTDGRRLVTGYTIIKSES